MWTTDEFLSKNCGGLFCTALMYVFGLNTNAKLCSSCSVLVLISVSTWFGPDLDLVHEAKFVASASVLIRKKTDVLYFFLC